MIKQVLRKVRVSQPLNFLATSAVRGVLSILKITPGFVVRHLHRAGVVRSALPNGRVLKLWSRGDDWVCTQIYWKGLSGYEPETVPLFLRLATSAQVIFDIGAYVGFYTVLAALASPSARVYAFEPHPNAYGRLLRNVKINHLVNVECLQAAAGEADTSSALFCGLGWLPTSSSLSAEFMGSHGAPLGVSCEVVSLDAFVRKCGIERVDLLKIDTESTEPQVLRGMLEILRRDRPSIICEVLRGRGAEDLLEDILGGLGYRYYLLTPSGPVLVPKVVGHETWLNYLFTCSELDSLRNQSEVPRQRASPVHV
jgi:FkbM family methyltransferase